MKHLRYFENKIDWEEDWEEEDPDYSEDIPSGEPMEFYKQYIGRKVMIKPGSKYYNSGIKEDPKDVVGTITIADMEMSGSVSSTGESNHIFNVNWKNGAYNDYRPEDLILVD